MTASLLVIAGSRHNSPPYIAIPIVIAAIAVGRVAMYVNSRRRR